MWHDIWDCLVLHNVRRILFNDKMAADLLVTRESLINNVIAQLEL